MKKLFLLLLVVGLFTTCSKEDQRAIDDQLIQDYLTENNIDAIKLEDSGVYYRITEEGNGVDYPSNFGSIRVFYKGYFLDGTVFDSKIEGEDDAWDTSLGGVVYGWQVALPNFSKNSKGEIFIPSHAGYGSQDRPGIPKNSVLIFEIHLVNVFN